MKLIHSIVFIAVVLIPQNYLCCQPIRFLRENISIAIADSNTTLDGIYVFGNRGNTPTGGRIFYPLLNTDKLPFPDSIAVFEEPAHVPLAFTRSHDGISFFIDINPSETKQIRIRYTQRSSHGMFEYILSTTQQWGEAIDSAEFLITIPNSLQLVSCSLPIDSEEHQQHGTIHHIQRTGFYPTSNLIIQWERSTP